MILACAAALTGSFLVRWPVEDVRLRARALRFIESSSGLNVQATGSMTLVLLPRPAVKLRNVGMRGLDGTISLDAESVIATLSLPALFTGHVRVTETTLMEPTVAIDADKLSSLIEAMNQSARPQAAAHPRLFAFLHTEGLSVRAGLLRVTSHDPSRDALLTEVNGKLEWADDESGFSLNGTADWHGLPAQLSFMLDAPGAWLRGQRSDYYVRVKSPAIDVTSSGRSSNRQGMVDLDGRLTATAASLPTFLRAIGTPLPQLAGVGQAHLQAAVSVQGGALSLSDVELGLDDMLFEGALAVHREAGHPAIAGTLATERINLDPFIRALPSLNADDGHWSPLPFGIKTIAFNDIDLRISASTGKIGPIEFEDGGFSVQSRDGRLELSLGEARAYDGLIKARIVATVDGDTTQVRADATLSQLDVGQLGDALDPSLHLAGTTSGHVALESAGASPAALVGGLTGRGQISVRGGEVGSGLMAAALPGGLPVTVAALRPGEALPFDSATIGFTLRQGVASVDEGLLARPDLRALFWGAASFADKTADLGAVVAPAEENTAKGGAPIATVRLTGPWRNLAVSVDADGKTGDSARAVAPNGDGSRAKGSGLP